MTTPISDITNAVSLQRWNPITLPQSTGVAELFVLEDQVFNLLSGIDGSANGYVVYSIHINVLVSDWTNRKEAIYTKEFLVKANGSQCSFPNEQSSLTIPFTFGDNEINNIVVTITRDGSGPYIHIFADRSSYAADADISVSATSVNQHLYIAF